MDFSLVTATATLHHVADLVERSLTPPGRAAATAATLRQIGDIAGNIHLTPAHVRASMIILASPSEDDTPPITARRRTCGEIGDTIEHSGVPSGPRLVPVHRAVASAMGTSADPRQVAIAATATREANELEAYFERVASAPRGPRRGESQMEALQRAVDDDRRNNDNH